MKTKVFPGLIILFALAFSAGCTALAATPTAMPTNPPATATSTVQPTTPPEPVSLQYIGHSTTLITAPDGTRVISDPYGVSRPSGLPLFPEDLTAEVVTVSHFHPDHANVSAVQGKPEIFYNPGSYQVGMIKITGFESDHGLIDGKSTGPNTVFVFEIGGIKIVHLGAAGVVTQGDLLAAMENADVVIVDIMGNAAHPVVAELDQLLELNVRTIIPTHYSFDEKHRYYGSVTLDEFIQIVPPELALVKRESTLEITANMPEQLVILAPAANEGQ